MMKPWSLVGVLAVVSLSSCGLSPEKEAVVAKARSIHEFPVSRKALMGTLGLENQPGDRMELGGRRGYAESSETWQHPAGLTITASGGDYIPGYRAITRDSVDEILNGPSRDLTDEDLDIVAAVVVPGVRSMPTPPPPRKSFDRFEVKDGKKVVFQSGGSFNRSDHVQ